VTATSALHVMTSGSLLLSVSFSSTMIWAIRNRIRGVSYGDPSRRRDAVIGARNRITGTQVRATNCTAHKTDPPIAKAGSNP
jgi:hypothetical protein